MAFILLFFSLSLVHWNTVDAQWITPSSPLFPTEGFRSDAYSAIGKYDGSIYIFNYGKLSQNRARLIEYDISADTFSFENITVTSTSWPYQNYQTSTQIGDTLYMQDIQYKYINTFNLRTKVFTKQAYGIPPVSHPASLCTDNTNIYAMGGDQRSDPRTFQILELSSGSWNIGPNMIKGRLWFPCAYANNKLYAIAGNNNGFGVVNTIEYISTTNVQSNSWAYTVNNMEYNNGTPDNKYMSSAAVHGDFIYVVTGGFDDRIYIIDTNTNSVTLMDDRIPAQSRTCASIVDRNILYAFGCTLPGYILDSNWYKYTLAPIPTEEPTPPPVVTEKPTTTTIAPTVDPTKSPTSGPTDACKIDECNDGKYCNGEEYCSDGQCHSGEVVECGFAFVCDNDSASCLRDCNSFDIEGYLQCSQSFGSVGTSIISINGEIDGIDVEIQGLDSRVITNEGDISDLDLKVDIFEADVALSVSDINIDIQGLSARVNGSETDITGLDSKVGTLESDVSDINTEIATLQSELNEVEDKIDRLGAGYMVNANMNPLNIMDNNGDGKTNHSIFESLQMKDILIIGLLLVNMIMSIYNCIYNKGNCTHSFKGKYSKVAATEFSDSEFSENQQLK